jgi:hypothetical protein
MDRTGPKTNGSMLKATPHLLFVLLMLVNAAAEPTNLTSLSAEWKELRAVKGHFQGGDYDVRVDRAGERKAVVLEKLREALSQPGTSEARVLGLLGEPDAREAVVLTTPADCAVLVYWWRGWHDFADFFCRDGKVIDSGWWLALE